MMHNAYLWQFCIMLYSATIFMKTHYGEGYHAWEVTQEDYTEIRRVSQHIALPNISPSSH